MKTVRKSVLIWYTPREMYDLVTGVRDYPRFLPWCERAEVLESSEQTMVARLHLKFAGVRHAFTTRNTQQAGEQVQLELVDGPFSHLDGLWQFVPIGDAAQPQACRIEFTLSYQIASRTLESVVGPVFDRIANTFVDAFVERAEVVYGPR